MQHAQFVSGSLVGLWLMLANLACGPNVAFAQASPAPAVPAQSVPAQADHPSASVPVASAPAADPSANAAAIAPLDQTEREALIEEGVRLRQEAKDEQALATFERAAALGRDGRVLAQIAFAEQAMGRWADSYVHLKAAVAEAADPWVRERLDMLKEELKKIEANVGRLEVRTNVAISKLTIDGKRVDLSHLAEPFIVPAGSVVVSAEAAGYLPTTRHVPVYAGSLSRAELVLVNEPTVQQRASAPSAEEQRVRNPVWLYVAGVGALTSIAAVGPWIRGERITEDLKKCSLPGSCLDHFDEDRDKVLHVLDPMYYGMLIGGLSVAALATASYFLFPRPQERAQVTTSAWLLPNSFGLTARIVH